MKLKKDIITILVVIILCITSFFGGMKYNSNQMLMQDRKYYLNQMYFEIDNTIQLLSSIDNWGNDIHNTDITANPFTKFLTHTSSMKAICEQAELYMNQDENRSFINNLVGSFRLIEGGVGSGISINDQQLCKDFLNDEILSKNEMYFLNTLKDDLQNIKNNLYSKNTKQENLDLSMKDLEKAFRPFTDKYSIANGNNIGFKN